MFLWLHSRPLLFYVCQRSALLLWLHSRPLLFYVCQRSASCSCGYILYHYCFMFVRGVLRVLVVTFSTITVLCFSEECLMLLWLHSRPLLFYVCQ